MKYKEIVAVTGLGGLYQLLTTKSDGAVVRNIADKTTKFISARKHNVTPLDSIEVYTTGDNVRLETVFLKMLEHETTIPPTEVKIGDNNAIKSYFKNIFPEFDDSRVYVSDMKKMLKWFDVLKANDLLVFGKEEGAEEVVEAGDTEAEAEPTAEVSVDAAAPEVEVVTETASEERAANTEEIVAKGE